MAKFITITVKKLPDLKLHLNKIFCIIRKSLDIEAGLLNESSCLTAALGVAKVSTIIAENWVTLYCALKDVQTNPP